MENTNTDHTRHIPEIMPPVNPIWHTATIDACNKK
jgi:hypothetical protein